MSIRSLLMPVISQRLFSRERLLAQRAKAERHRQRAGAAHEVHYFHQVDDPYSALAAQSLTPLLARYAIRLQAHVVGPPPDAAAPEREKLVAYSRRDADMLARRAGLDFADPGRQPDAKAVQGATAQLVAAIAAGRFVDEAANISNKLWAAAAGTSGEVQRTAANGVASEVAVAAHVQASGALRESLGHYLGAMFFYAGEWYWGIDRLYHLEQRLQDLGAQRDGATAVMFPPADDLTVPTLATRPLPAGAAIDFFVSLRSPYSAIVAKRVFDLGRRTGAPVRIRYVLPMVMRGLPVPKAKRQYIAHDAAREAFVRGIPFGRINDPVGRPTERGIALIPLAERLGLGEAYLCSFMQGVWAEGLNAGSDRALRTMAERAGLRWDDALAALGHEGWRAIAEANRAEMFSLGLWGVPSFRVGSVSVWGQDRLWAVQDALYDLSL